MPSTKRSRSKRPGSFGILDTDLADESGLSSLDEVARSLSKSAELLEQKQKEAENSRSSAFRKAVEGAGITQLPKRPSSIALNAALATNNSNSNGNSIDIQNKQTSTVLSPNLSPPPDTWITNPLQHYGQSSVRHNAGWNETSLDGPDLNVTKLDKFESQPIDVDMVRVQYNMNNNSRLSVNRSRKPKFRFDQNPIAPEDLPHRISEQKIDQNYSRNQESHSNRSKTKRHTDESKTKSSSKKSSFSFSSHSHHSTGDRVWEERIINPSSDSIHSPQVTEMDQNVLDSWRRLQIRPHGPSAAPPMYSTSTSRYRSPPNAYSDVYSRTNNSAWLPTRRKDSASITVQTDTSQVVEDSTLV